MAVWAFAKAINASDFWDDAFEVSNLWPLTSDTFALAYTMPTSLSNGWPTSQIHFRIYTISSNTFATDRSVSGANPAGVGYFNPAVCGNSDNSVLLCSYNAGDFRNPYTGFVVNETSDSGATWTNAYSGGGSYNNDFQRGLYQDVMTKDVYMVTNSFNVGGYKVNVHKRTGAGTWTVTTAFTGTATNYYILDQSTYQCAVFANGKALIVGPKQDGSIWALRYDGTSWTEVLIKAHNDFVTRICKMVRTSDGVIRVFVQGGVGETVPFFKNAAPSLYLSKDLGATWVILGIPPGLGMEDQNGNPIGWPSGDQLSFTLDGRGRMFLTLGDQARPYLQTFRAWSTAYNSWGHLATDTISDGGGNTYIENYLSELPSSSLAVGADLFRVVCAWIDGSSVARAWLLKAAGASLAPGGHTGGGGQPRTYSAGD